MRNSEELTPEQQVRVGHFSAVKANIAFDAIRRHEAKLKEVNDQSRSTTENELAESRREFREACEEAAKYIGPGTVGEFAIIASTRDDLFASASC